MRNMGKIKDNIGAFIPLTILLAIGIPCTIKELKEQEIEKAERSRQREIEERVEYFKHPMVWNGNSLLVGYLFEDAYISVYEEDEEISYSKYYDKKEDAVRVFDSLFVEICKHHCDSLAPHKFTSQYNRKFECSHTGASVVLRYRGTERGSSEIEIAYKIPQKLGHRLGEEWQQYLVVD